MNIKLTLLNVDIWLMNRETQIRFPPAKDMTKVSQIEA